MKAYRSEFLHILGERGFLNQLTHPQELDHACEKSGVVGYCGFDATALSLHVGNLVQLMVLKWMKELGHRPIALLGGATSQIGDPTFRSDSRVLLSPQKVQENIAGIAQSISAVVGEVDVVNNHDWFSDIRYLDFLRTVGIHFSVNRMIAFEHMAQRLEKEEPLSFIEFNYLLVQSYDFMELYQRYGCRVQFGGSDQWGNIVSGVDLVRRALRQQVYAFTTPLVTTAGGQKMGKTAQGAVWLNAELCQPYQFWQFWRSIDDGDVGQFLRLFTMLPLQEVAKLEALQGAELNEAKVILANEVTKIVHGAEVCEAVQKTLLNLSSGHWTKQALELPTFLVALQELSKGFSILDALERAQLVASRSEGKRKVKEGAVVFAGTKAIDAFDLLKKEDFCEGRVLLCLGSKHKVVFLLQ